MTNSEPATPAEASAGYQKTIRVRATPEALFDAVTTTAGLAAWWVPRVSGSGSKGGDLKIFMGPPEPLLIHVDEATRPASVQWTVTECSFEPDWVGTRPTFIITPDGDGKSRLDFRHQGLTSELPCFGVCRPSWDHFIAKSLRELVESGHGHPAGSPADRAWRADVRATRE